MANKLCVSVAATWCTAVPDVHTGVEKKAMRACFPAFSFADVHTYGQWPTYKGNPQEVLNMANLF